MNRRVAGYGPAHPARNRRAFSDHEAKRQSPRQEHLRGQGAEPRGNCQGILDSSIRGKTGHVQRTIQHYNLDIILAIGYRVGSSRGVQFRQWAITHLKEYLVIGFVMDDERVKNPDGWDCFALRELAENVTTTMVHTHALNTGPKAVRSSLDGL